MVDNDSTRRLFRHYTHELVDELSYRLKTGTRSVEYQDVPTVELWEYIKKREDTILKADTK